MKQLRAKTDNQRANSLTETSEPSDKPPFAGLASLADILFQVHAQEGDVTMEEFLELLIFANRHTTTEQRLEDGSDDETTPRNLAEGACSTCDNRGGRV